jgi:heme oxygenase
MQHPSLRFQLRERTSTAHRAVDDAVGTFDDLASYRRYLAGLHAFRAPVEAMLGHGGAWAFLGDWRLEPLVPLIEADMADLDMEVERTAGTAAGHPPTAEGVAGALYVLEGSSLGARILEARARGLGLGASFGARHLAAQAHGGPGFGRFVERLEAAALSREAVIEAALAVFSAAERAFAAAAGREVAHATA